MKTGPVSILASVLFVCVAAAADLRPRPPVFKPAHTMVDERFQPRLLTVKFNDGLHIRVRDERLTDFGSGQLEPAQALLESLGTARWMRVDSVPEATIDQMRQVAQTNLGIVIADLNLQVNLLLPPGTNVAEVIDALNALDIVELAQPIPRLSPLPIPPNLQSQQGYLSGAPGGVNAISAWRPCVGRGAGIKLADVEASFNINHIDLQPVQVLGGDLNVNDFDMENHGTASLGVVGSRNNGYGTTGIAAECTLLFSGVMFWDIDLELFFYNAPNAIMTAIAALSAGDVLQIELQGQGPGGFVPLEWDKPCYDRIVLAVGLGIVVVEPAGNGGNNLDDPVYSTGNGGHWPFTLAQDSGAIMVGAGAAPAGFGGSTTERSRLTFSNYGTTVDVQGWGEMVATTGYGGLYNLGGVNELYTGTYGGTSSAAPMVAGTCVLLQGAYKIQTTSVLLPSVVKQFLIATGSPQQAGLHPVSEQIGPLPNVNAAINAAIPAVIYYNQFGASTRLHWKICDTVLQSTELLVPGGEWTNIPTTNNTYTYTYESGVNTPTRFFRLQILDSAAQP
jgi:serine protease